MPSDNWRGRRLCRESASREACRREGKVGLASAVDCVAAVLNQRSNGVQACRLYCSVKAGKSQASTALSVMPRPDGK
eukprot:9887041-Lingulodinium_polyedra.AAC.1